MTVLYNRRERRFLTRLTPEQREAWARVQAWVQEQAAGAAAAYRSSPLAAWYADLTARVLHLLRTTPKVAADYQTAIGGSGVPRGNQIQARMNRGLGRLVKAASGASVRSGPDGSPLMPPVKGEWHLTFTVLNAPPRVSVA